MRKVIVDQIEALAELNRIVAHHGRGLDVVTAGRASVQREEEPMMAAAGGSRDAAPRMRDAGSASTLPPPDLGMPASRRTEAPPVSPASADQGRDGWLSDLLNRTDAGGGNRDAPAWPPAAAGRRRNPLESLSLDIGRLMDRNLAAEMWDRYQRGESKAFTKRLYTPAGQKAFDEVARKYRADRGFKQTVDRYIAEFERLLDEVARDERGPRRCAATSPRRPGSSTPCSRTRRDGWGKASNADRRIAKKTEASRPPFCVRIRECRLRFANNFWIYYRIYQSWSSAMANTAQKRALRNYRTRLVKRGMARFEVLGLDADRDLIRSLAKRLAENDPDAVRIRAAVSQTISRRTAEKGRHPCRIAPLAAGRGRSRSRAFARTGRKVDL